MPAKIEIINAFDLRLLKALINLRKNEDYKNELSPDQKKNLCSSFNKEDGVLEISPEYILKIWPKKKDISLSLTLDTLNQFCRILKYEYRWYSFEKDIARFRPSGIPNNKTYTDLNETQKKEINDAIYNIFKIYKSFEDFKKEIIDKEERDDEIDDSFKESNIEELKDSEAIFYDAYGYSNYRKDLFYYKLKIYRNKKIKDEKTYFVNLLTFDIELRQHGSFDGDIIVKENYAYFKINIKNSEKKVKREFYFILFLGDKSIEDLNIGFATYCISSRKMEVSAGELIMQRVGNDLIPENLPIEVCRYFQTKKPQLRALCITVLNLKDIIIENDLNHKLSNVVGNYKLIFTQEEKGEKFIFQAKLVIKENFNCYIIFQDEIPCNIKVVDNNLHIFSLHNKSSYVHNVIFQLSDNSLLEGVYSGINKYHIPSSGKIIALKTTKEFQIRYFNKKQINEFVKQGVENKKLLKIINT